MDESILADFCVVADQAGKELLEYSQLPAQHRNEADEGWLRKLIGVMGALNSCLAAARAQPANIPPQPLPAPGQTRFPLPPVDR